MLSLRSDDRRVRGSSTSSANAAAIFVGIGIISSADDTSAAIDPALASDVCRASSGSSATVDDELDVRLHLLVTSAVGVDTEAAQRLSDLFDQAAADVAATSDSGTFRSDVDAAVAATGQDRLECDR
jgi:hypothetical protein